MATIVYRSVHGTCGRYVHVSMYNSRVPFVRSRGHYGCRGTRVLWRLHEILSVKRTPDDGTTSFRRRDYANYTTNIDAIYPYRLTCVVTMKRGGEEIERVLVPMIFLLSQVPKFGNIFVVNTDIFSNSQKTNESNTARFINQKNTP